MEDKLDLLDCKKLASVLDISVRTIYLLRSTEQLPTPFIRNGRRVYWTRQQILSWQAATSGNLRQVLPDAQNT